MSGQFPNKYLARLPHLNFRDNVCTEAEATRVLQAYSSRAYVTWKPAPDVEAKCDGRPVPDMGEAGTVDIRISYSSVFKQDARHNVIRVSDRHCWLPFAMQKPPGNVFRNPRELIRSLSYIDHTFVLPRSLDKWPSPAVSAVRWCVLRCLAGPVRMVTTIACMVLVLLLLGELASISLGGWYSSAMAQADHLRDLALDQADGIQEALRSSLKETDVALQPLLDARSARLDAGDQPDPAHAEAMANITATCIGAVGQAVAGVRAARTVDQALFVGERRLVGALGALIFIAVLAWMSMIALLWSGVPGSAFPSDSDVHRQMVEVDLPKVTLSITGFDEAADEDVAEAEEAVGPGGDSVASAVVSKPPGVRQRHVDGHVPASVSPSLRAIARAKGGSSNASTPTRRTRTRADSANAEALHRQSGGLIVGGRLPGTGKAVPITRRTTYWAAWIIALVLSIGAAVLAGYLAVQLAWQAGTVPRRFEHLGTFAIARDTEGRIVPADHRLLNKWRGVGEVDEGLLADVSAEEVWTVSSQRVPARCGAVLSALAGSLADSPVVLTISSQDLVDAMLTAPTRPTLKMLHSALEKGAGAVGAGRLRGVMQAAAAVLSPGAVEEQVQIAVPGGGTACPSWLPATLAEHFPPLGHDQLTAAGVVGLDGEGEATKLLPVAVAAVSAAEQRDCGAVTVQTVISVPRTALVTAAVGIVSAILVLVGRDMLLDSANLGFREQVADITII